MIKKLPPRVRKAQITIKDVIYPLVSDKLSAKEQAELLVMVLRRDTNLAAELWNGEVWIDDPNLSLENVVQNQQYGGRKLTNHFWTYVHVYKDWGFYIDYKLQSIIGQEHPSIPNGIFLRHTYRHYSYRPIAAIKIWRTEEKIKELMDKL